MARIKQICWLSLNRALPSTVAPSQPPSVIPTTPGGSEAAGLSRGLLALSVALPCGLVALLFFIVAR
jgi:hypothetical protein